MSWRDDIHEAVDGVSRRTGYTRTNCPACDERVGKTDRKSSVSINLSNGWWRCWRCDWRGRLRDYDDADIDFDDPSDGWEDVAEEREIEKPSEYFPLPGIYLLEAARKYLRSRSIHENLWTQARLGYAMRGTHRNRIIMPIWRYDGHWIGWVGRHIGRTPINYWTAKGMDRRSVFYNDIALSEVTDTPLIVTEGPMDALRHWPDAVAALGKPTGDHIDRLCACKRPIVIALDGDSWREGLAIAQRLRHKDRRAYAIALPATEDLDSTDPNLVRYGVRRSIERNEDTDLRQG